jgi:Kef-type K+ transport system membrane component KefB
MSALLNFFDGQSLFTDAIAQFIVQLLLILVISRSLHFVLDRLLQEPLVISEMVAGILLGRLFLIVLSCIGCLLFSPFIFSSDFAASPYLDSSSP